MNRPRFNSIAAQLIALAVVPSIALAFAFALLWYTTEQRELELEYTREAEAVAAGLARGAEFAISSNNLELIDLTLRSALKHPNIVSASVLRLDRSSVGEAVRDGNRPNASTTRRFEHPISDSGRSGLTALAPAGVVGTAVIEVDQSALIHARGTLRWTVAVAFLSLSSLLVVVIFLWARRLSAPLTTLTDVVRRLSRGDLAARVQPVGTGEIRDLELGINHLARVIGDNQRQLSEKIHAATVALKEQRDQATAASQAKSRFLAAASHDLRQPMHALGLFCTALEKRITEPDQRKLLSNIHTSLRAMEELFESLLDLSRLEAGRVVANVDRVALQEVFSWIDLEYSAAARDKGLRFRVRQTDAWVQADIALLRRVLMNLVANAIRYTQSGGVLVGAQRRGDAVRIGVWDTGPGIDAASREAIFEEFVQLRHETSDKTKGLGLGLAIAKRSAELMGTTIRVQSTPNRGSLFSITLVNARSRARARGPKATPTMITASTQTMLQLSGQRVLVIEDDEPGRQAMRALLSQWGCDVRDADSGNTACERVRDGWQPEVIVSDFRLRAGETGLDAIARVKQVTGRDAPVVIVSGELALSIDAESLGHPDWVVLRKPVSAGALREAMQTVRKHG